MSVINQVLNKLEQRGAHSAIDQAMVRSVPQRTDNTRVKLGVAMVLVGTAIAMLVWQWPLLRGADASFKLAERNTTEVMIVSTPVAAAAGAGPSGVVGTQIDTPQSAATKQLRLVPGLTAKPVIASISPDPVTVRTGVQQLVIQGSGFTPTMTVILRKSGGKTYTNRPIVTQSDTQITINAKLGKYPDNWTVELVEAGGVTSGEFPFAVQARAIPRAAGSTVPRTESAGHDTRLKRISPAQQADAEYHKALTLMHQGQQAAAMKAFEAALGLDAGHDEARQAMVVALLAEKRGDEAERVLREGLKSKPDHTGLAMLLARVQVERGGIEQALATLEQYLPRAEAQADFQAFYAALLQRQKRHQEAIVHYQIALQHAPNNGVWLMGFAISLYAEHRNDDARQMFQRALDTATLSAELQAFVRQKLKEL